MSRTIVQRHGDPSDSEEVEIVELLGDEQRGGEPAVSAMNPCQSPRPRLVGIPDSLFVELDSWQPMIITTLNNVGHVLPVHLLTSFEEESRQSVTTLTAFTFV